MNSVPCFRWCLLTPIWPSWLWERLQTLEIFIYSEYAFSRAQCEAEFGMSISLITFDE